MLCRCLAHSKCPKNRGCRLHSVLQGVPSRGALNTLLALTAAPGQLLNSLAASKYNHWGLTAAAQSMSRRYDFRKEHPRRAQQIPLLSRLMSMSRVHSYAAKPDTAGGVVHLLPHRSQKPSVQWQAELLRAAFVGVTGRPGLLCPAQRGPVSNSRTWGFPDRPIFFGLLKHPKRMFTLPLPLKDTDLSSTANKEPVSCSLPSQKLVFFSSQRFAW